MSIFGHTIVGRPPVSAPRGVATDVTRNPIFASVAADQRFVPGGHYSLAECRPFASPRPRNARGQFVKKEQDR